MEIKTHKCDVCGKQKGEANRWFKGWLSTGALAVTPFARANPLHASHYAGSLATDTSEVQELHFCGEECAAKKLSEVLGESR